jgi:hypothetical protein
MHPDMSSISENRSTLREFLASIATISGDLSNITAPPFVLATQSTTELPQYWAEHPSILVAPASEPDPQKRALLVLKWFLSSLKNQQYAGRSEKEGVKKPLNAFLGELFIAHWDDEGVTRLISEQVSHHPPVTACCLWNEKHGVRAEGYTRQEITFNGSVNIRQIGHAILHLDKWDEDFLIPLPNVKVKGLLSGTPYPELSGSYSIASSSGFVSEIDFSGKGFFSGAKNSFQARVYEDVHRTKLLYKVSGNWNDKFTIFDVVEDKEIETYDSANQPSTRIHVEDIEDQDPWESRRAWRGVIESLNKGDMSGTSREKAKVEQGQRNMRKEEERKGKKWKPAFYRQQNGDPVFEKLAAMVGAKLEADKTMGVWKLDGDAVKNLKKPYHADIVPTNTASEGETPASTPRGSTDQALLTNRGQVNRARRGSLLPVNLKEQQQEIERIKQKGAIEVAERKQVEDFLRSMYSSSGR